MGKLVFTTLVIMNEVAEIVINNAIDTYNFFYAYSDFCVEHNMV
jgi:hypothetical protein